MPACPTTLHDAQVQGEAEALRAWRLRERQTARIEAVLERAPDELLGAWCAGFIAFYMRMSGIVPWPAPVDWGTVEHVPLMRYPRRPV